jgi:DNA adenine methylase
MLVKSCDMYLERKNNKEKFIPMNLQSPSQKSNEMIRPFLKWPGGKFRLIERIRAALPAAKLLVEPFVGSGAVFLNTNYEKYLLNDANHDLIMLYKILQKKGPDFIEFCRDFFVKKYNTEKKYYRFRSDFNTSQDPYLKSALFLYLNRHGYNGLCRYNMRKGEFNVPFGCYVKPYFPEKEMLLFHRKSKKVIFTCEDFSKTMNRIKNDSVVYCDPPYVPLTATSAFTAYQAGGFDLNQQRELAILAKKIANKGIPVLLSNHSNDFTREVYQGALINEFSVQRFISCKVADRAKVLELLALYPA